jgi:hypothetical protein
LSWLGFHYLRHFDSNDYAVKPDERVWTFTVPFFQRRNRVTLRQQESFYCGSFALLVHLIVRQANDSGFSRWRFLPVGWNPWLGGDPCVNALCVCRIRDWIS